MRRRNVIMAGLSVLFLVLLLMAMALAVSSGLGSIGLVIGGLSYVLLLGIVVLSFPILIFVIITIILLVLEDSAATRGTRAHWWSRRKSTEPMLTVGEREQGR